MVQLHKQLTRVFTNVYIASFRHGKRELRVIKGLLMLKRTLAVLLLVFVVACGGGKIIWVAQPVSGPIAITPERAWVHGGKLWIRTIVANNSGQPITIVRDNIVLRLPTNQVVQRAPGGTHEPYFIAPGAAHQVYVEFAGDWETVPNAMVDYSPGVLVNGQPMQVSPLPVAPAR